jgi:hypothetical protein
MEDTMKRTFLTLISLLALVSVAVVVAASQKKTPATPSREQLLKRGEYMVTIGGCHDCHTPWIIQPDGKPGPDMTRQLSGHPEQFPISQPAQIRSDRWAVATAPMNTAFSGPWGVSFAANLSPDENTGTGIWTFDMFKNTIRKGRHWGVARPLLPPMPWFNYRHMTDEDLLAVYTYIHSLPPIRNQVQQPLPPAQIAEAGDQQNSTID